MKTRLTPLMLAALAGSGIPPAIAAAATADAAAAANAATDDSEVNQVIVTGTRETNVKARDSAAPIAIIGGAELAATGATDLREALERTLPSLNRQSESGDLAALTSAIQLRGLSPDQVLVLVNGKRRHTTANITLDGGPQQGAAPVDLDLIPISAIDHIEVLEDGAAAQYGSDAIAGVINIILKSRNHGGQIEGTTGQYYFGDGFTAGGDGSIATTLGSDGYLDASIDYKHHDHSVRSGWDTRTSTLTPAGDDPVLYPPTYVYDNPIFGDPETTRTSIGINAAKPLGDAVELYGFGTYATRWAEAFENYRLPTVLPAVYPDGFAPQETIDENDYSATLGLRGDQLFGWHWDLSSTYGADDDDFGLKNSGNPGLYKATGSTPTSFHISTNILTQWANNLDLTHPFDVGFATPLNLAGGLEYRRETYSLSAGDPTSYIDGGSQSYVGLQPTSAGRHQRSNDAVYVDLSADPVAGWHVDVAGRYEHYTDFGDTESGKFTTRYDFNPRFALRGTVSNGFRAPSLAQEYFSNLNVSPTGASGLLAVDSAAAQHLGAVPLRPEKSINFSLGSVAEPLDGLHTTLDAYLIRITDRIIPGGVYEGPTAVSTLENYEGITFPVGIDPADVSAQYFSNGADTKTYGLDFTADYRTDLGAAGSIDWDAEANWNHNQVTKVDDDLNGNPLLNAQGIAFLTTAQPQSKIILGGVWKSQGFSVTLHEVRYGQSTFQETFYQGPNIYSNSVFYRHENPARYITNIEAGYTWDFGLQWVVGANNLFDIYPSQLPVALRYIGAAQYDGNTGVSIDGGYYYTRLSYKF